MILSRKFEQFKKFRSDILDVELISNQVNEIYLDKIVINKFTEFIFEKGTREEKRGLINCLEASLYLKKRKLITIIDHSVF